MTHEQLVVFGPFSVILCEAEEKETHTLSRVHIYSACVCGRIGRTEKCVCVGGKKVCVCACVLPVFDEGLEVEGEAHAEREKGRILLQDFGQNLKVGLAVLIGELSRGQLHLQDAGGHDTHKDGRDQSTLSRRRRRQESRHSVK